MIEKLEISDYRSCLKTTIALQPDLSVLIGPNGSGKTNVLNSLVLLRSLTSDREGPLRRDDQPTNQSRLKVTFRYKDRKAILTATVNLLTDENNADVILGAHQSWYVKDFTGSARRLEIPLWFARHMRTQRRSSGDVPMRYYARLLESELHLPESFREALGAIGEFLRDMKYYSASQFTNPSLCPVSFEVEQEGRHRRGLRIRGQHNRFLYDLYGARESESYEEFFSVIGPNGIGLVDKIDFKEILTSSIDYTVRSGGSVQQRKREKVLVVPQFTIGRNNLSPSQLSEGTFKTITLLFYLITEHSSALLIEEPEVCVHHGLLSSIIELIKTYSQQKQIIVSTHSDFVLDQIEPKNVYRVERTATEGTQVTQITKSMSSKELAALRKYLDTEGNLGEYWRHGGFE